jgi:hypothetical protein
VPVLTLAGFALLEKVRKATVIVSIVILRRTDVMEKYILAGTQAVPIEDTLTWGKWYETADRKVLQTYIGKKVRVSTVFLGVNHNWNTEEPPLLFETMIFGGEYGDYQARCSTWEQALVQHEEAVASVSTPAGVDNPFSEYSARPGSV